jgi:peptidoglycan/LPS O-acetylase OafA/YrhL
LTTDGVAVGSQPESRSLTGLRSVGALLVLLHHFSLHFGLEPPIPLIGPMLRRGYLGVDLFFVLSGFVIAMVYGSWFGAGLPGFPGRWALFMVRRAARLWPLHAAVVGVALLSLALEGAALHPLTVLANLLMVQGWGFSTEINSPAWSVSTEWFAYAIFPLLAPLMLRERAGVALGLACVVALLATDMVLAPALGLGRRGELDIYYNYSVLPVLRCLAGFMLGMAAWRWGRVAAVRAALGNGWAGPAALASMLALMMSGVHDLVVYPLLPLIVLGFHLGRGPVVRLFASGPLYRLGVLSYGFYLVHFMILQCFPFGWGPRWVELAAYVAVTAGVAAGLHRWVERPCRVVLRRWGEAALGRVLHGPVVMVPLQGGPLQGGPG